MAPSVNACLVWCSVIVIGLLTVVTAQQPMVSARIVTPEDDRKEGGQVNMTCLAENLTQNHVVSWKSRGSGLLRWGRNTQVYDQRLTFRTTELADEVTVMQDLSITDLQTADDGEYICEVNQYTGSNYRIVAASSVMLSVLYFPREPYPICSPNGSMIVDPGTELNLQCSSEVGNPEVMMEVSQIGTTSIRYAWSSSNTSSTVVMSLDLTANDSDVEFNCTISSVSYPRMNRSCTIGPILVTSGTQPSTGPTTEPTTETSSTIVIVSASAGGAAVLLLIIILIVVCWRRGLCKIQPTLQKSDTKRHSSSTNTVLTTDAMGHAGPSFNDESRQEMGESNTYHHTIQVTIAAKPDTAVLYALPHKPSTNVEAKIESPDQSVETSKEQPHSNPVFDSKDPESTIRPFRDNTTSATLKPVAKVLPVSKSPTKLQPYKPKAQRGGNTNDGTPNQQNPTRSQSTPPAHSDAVTSGGFPDNGDDEGDEKDHLPPGVEASHAPVSSRQQKHTGTGRSSEPSNIVYAELDLQSGLPSGVNAGPALPSGDEPVVYASVVNVTNM